MAEPKPCQYCSGEKTLYQQSSTTKIYLGALGTKRILITECKQCPPFAKCALRNITARSAFFINYCPECGRKLNERKEADHA